MNFSGHPKDVVNVISFVSVKYQEDAISDVEPDEWRHADPAASLWVVANVYFLTLQGRGGDALPTAVQFDGSDVPGPLLATRCGDQCLIAGHAPSLLADRPEIRAVRLSIRNDWRTLRFRNRPLQVQNGEDALASTLSLLDGPDRSRTLSFILRVFSSLLGDLDPPLALLIGNILRNHATVRDGRAYVLDEQHFYWRVALPEKSAAADAVAVRCFFLKDRKLIQLSCGKALRTAGGELHMLSRRPTAEGDGCLIVVVGSATLAARIRPARQSGFMDSLDTAVGGHADIPHMIKCFLLSRCAELYRSHKSPDVLALGNRIWAQTPFAPQAVVRPDMEFGAAIECILPVAKKGLLIVGWLVDSHRLLDHLELVDGQGRLGKISATCFRYDRPDVSESFPGLGCEAAGFIAFHRCPAINDLWPTYQVKGVLKGGAVIDLMTDVKASRKALSSAEVLLGLVPADKATPDFYRQIMPAVSYLQARKSGQARIRRVFPFLTRVAEPDITIVVPIYKRLDHARHQLAHFAADSSLAATELIYVLDSPERENEFAQHLDAWCRLYRRPATLAVMPRNCGFAGATNAGARLGRGRFLVLLNSDVIPAAPGWTGAMQRILESDETIGAAGACLLYEDGAIQHAGMDYACDSGGSWKVVHPGKGLRVNPQSRAVSGVTAACMMLRADDYKAVGGLSEDYVIGDFEDSDLCLKLRARGKSIWFCAEAVLYHLERQSMGVDGRYTPTIRRYNQALHQKRWAATLVKTQT